MATADRGNNPPLVLCVDDDAAMLRLNKMVLECEGYSVLTATTGEAALQEFSAQPIDAVVLDYEMPRMNGAQVALEMKRLNPHVPKLLFSAHSTLPAQAASAVEAFCTKAAGTSPLLFWLRETLDRRAQPFAAANVSDHKVAMSRRYAS